MVYVTTAPLALTLHEATSNSHETKVKRGSFITIETPHRAASHSFKPEGTVYLLLFSLHNYFYFKIM